MSSGPYQPTHPFPFPAPSSTRGLNAHQPLSSDALKRPANEARHMPAPLAVTISTGRRTVEATLSAEHNVDVPDRLTKRPEECRHQPSTVSTATTDVTRPTSAATDVATRVVGSDTSRAKPGATEASSSGAEAEGAAAEPVERTSILIKAKRKSLHEMRHLQNIAAAEEPSTECEEGQNTTKTTKQRGTTSNDNNNGCPVPSSDKLRQVAEEPSAPDDPSDDDPSPSPFPSLTDELLQQLEKRDDNDDKTLNPEELSLQESEEKFTSLALAFKTDRETLSKRIELHLRARDVAEQNIHKELESLKDGIKVLNQSCTSCPSSSSQVFTKIQTHFDVLEKSITRMSSRAEVHGAVQQELRVSQVIETMLEHVENLKRTYQTEHRELQEARQSLNDGSQDGTETPGSSKVVDRANFGAIGAGKGSLRRISLALMAKSPKLLRNTSLPVSDSIYSSSPAAATPPLPPTSMLFSNDIQENSCPDDDDDAIASRGSNKPPQPNRRYTTNQAAPNGDRRLSADDVRKRRFAISHRGSVSNRGGVGISKDEGRVDPVSESGLDQKKQTVHRELLMRVLSWFVALLRLLLQRSSIVSIRDGLSVLLGAISKFHPLRVVPPALIVIVMFLMSAATLLVVIWTRWRVPSQAMPSR